MKKTLQKVRQSLPASWYFDPDHYQFELERIWYREWVCVGHVDALQRSGDYFTTTIGDQNIIVTRAKNGAICAWYNTCTHRGSRLCTSLSGRFSHGRIICPYHTWTFSTDGELLATPNRIETSDFNKDNFSLHGVHADTWRGFVFVNLDDAPVEDLSDFMADKGTYVDNWPLEDLHPVHREVHTVACNWKIYWENYSECYHCPRLHPELCKIMPVYAKGVFDDGDLPDWEPRFDGDNGFGHVAEDATTWTMDGNTELPLFEGLTDQERDDGLIFIDITGTFYLVAHADYVRTVRLVPKGPESTDLVIDWLLPANPDDVCADTIERIKALPMLVIEQDGAACELNQQGIKSRPFDHGILVPQEYAVWDFHEWLRDRLGEADVSD